MRKRLGYRLPNPLISNIFLDSCAFDPKYSPEDEASQQIFKRELKLLKMTHSTQKEIDHPNTPDWVKREATDLIYTLPTTLTPNELKQKADILRILAGKGKPEKVAEDANHVFEASKYGGGYFITTDRRILNKKNDLRKVCSAIIVKPSEFLKILTMYENITP